MSEQKNIIEIINLELIKQSEFILKNINVKIKSNGITFIIGPNGAENSTSAKPKWAGKN